MIIIALILGIFTRQAQAQVSVSALGDASTPGTLLGEIASAPTDGTTKEITLTAQIIINTSATLEEPAGSMVTILRGWSGSLFSIGNGGNLTIGNITIDGDNDSIRRHRCRNLLLQGND